MAGEGEKTQEVAKARATPTKWPIGGAAASQARPSIAAVLPPSRSQLYSPPSPHNASNMAILQRVTAGVRHNFSSPSVFRSHPATETA